MTTIDVSLGTISIDDPAAMVTGRRVASPTLVGRCAELAALVSVVADTPAVGQSCGCCWPARSTSMEAMFSGSTGCWFRP